jgi:FeS assembly SUF system regulator
MFKLAKLTDYAIVVLSRLSLLADGASISASALAVDTGIPEPTVAKVLKTLAKAELVTSQRGVNGGYTLARSGQKMTLLEVITAIEGPIALTSCVTGSKGECVAEHYCPSKGRWDVVNEAVREALARVTLADMVRSDYECASAKKYKFMEMQS